MFTDTLSCEQPGLPRRHAPLARSVFPHAQPLPLILVGVTSAAKKLWLTYSKAQWGYMPCAILTRLIVALVLEYGPGAVCAAGQTCVAGVCTS